MAESSPHTLVLPWAGHPWMGSRIPDSSRSYRHASILSYIRCLLFDSDVRVIIIIIIARAS